MDAGDCGRVGDVYIQVVSVVCTLMLLLPVRSAACCVFPCVCVRTACVFCVRRAGASTLNVCSPSPHHHNPSSMIITASPLTHLTSTHLTSPHLTSPHLTSPHLTSPTSLLYFSPNNNILAVTHYKEKHSIDMVDEMLLEKNNMKQVNTPHHHLHLFLYLC